MALERPDLGAELVEEAGRCEAGRVESDSEVGELLVAEGRGCRHTRIGLVVAKAALATALLVGAAVAAATLGSGEVAARAEVTDVRSSVGLYDELNDELYEDLAGKVGVPIPPKLVAQADAKDGTSKVAALDDTFGKCRDGEELFLGLCYKSCAVLTAGDMTIRSAPTACCRQQPCFLPGNVEMKGFLPCSGFEIDGEGKCPRPPGECDSNEEQLLGSCYKMCSILTQGEYPKRVGPNTCCKGSSCWNPFNLKTDGGVCTGFAVGGGAKGHECPHSGS